MVNTGKQIPAMLLLAIRAYLVRNRIAASNPKFRGEVRKLVDLWELFSKKPD
jgi:hypothetical protein